MFYFLFTFCIQGKQFSVDCLSLSLCHCFPWEKERKRESTCKLITRLMWQKTSTLHRCNKRSKSILCLHSDIYIISTYIAVQTQNNFAPLVCECIYIARVQEKINSMCHGVFVANARYAAYYPRGRQPREELNSTLKSWMCRRKVISGRGKRATWQTPSIIINTLQIRHDLRRKNISVILSFHQ